MSGSALFRFIAAQQGQTPWGSMLDAGAGVHSLSWICGLPTDRWTAVTASPEHLQQINRATAVWTRPQDRLVLGDWADPGLLQGEVHDTVLADYLLGAVEGFAPFFQDQLFARLRGLVGRRLYVVGLEPYVLDEPDDPAGRLIWEIGRLRDACLLLAGETPYREYPAAWTTMALERAGFRVLAQKAFANRYRPGFVESQIGMCRQRLSGLADRDLAGALGRHAEALRTRALARVQAEGGLRHGHDYVIVAEPRR